MPTPKWQNHSLVLRSLPAGVEGANLAEEDAHWVDELLDGDRRTLVLEREVEDLARIVLVGPHAEWELAADLVRRFSLSDQLRLNELRVARLRPARVGVGVGVGDELVVPVAVELGGEGVVDVLGDPRVAP